MLKPTEQWSIMFIQKHVYLMKLPAMTWNPADATIKSYSNSVATTIPSPSYKRESGYLPRRENLGGTTSCTRSWGWSPKFPSQTSCSRSSPAILASCRPCISSQMLLVTLYDPSCLHVHLRLPCASLRSPPIKCWQTSVQAYLRRCKSACVHSARMHLLLQSQR